MADVHKLFKSKSNLELLKTKLPNDIIYLLYPYIVDTNYKQQFNYVIAFIPFIVKMKTFKRCTPCLRCNKINTYSKYCSKCDNDLWMELG